MKKVNKFLFAGYGVENDKLVEDVKERIVNVVKTREPVLKEYQAEGFMEINSGANKGICGIYYKGEQSNRKYLKNERYIGDGYYSYTPKLNTKMGKALAEKMKAPDMYFDYSGYIIEKTGITPDWVFNVGDGVYLPVAGIAKGHIILSIPYDEETNKDIKTTLPDWLKEVDEVEWAALM